MDATNVLPEMLGLIPLAPILWGFSILAGLLFLVHAAIMTWHWREYSTGAYTSAANMLVYLGVGLGFVVLMLLSALWYSLA